MEFIRWHTWSPKSSDDGGIENKSIHCLFKFDIVDQDIMTDELKHKLSYSDTDSKNLNYRISSALSDKSEFDNKCLEIFNEYLKEIK